MADQTTQGVQVGTIAAVTAPPTIELGVQSPISGELQQVQDEQGNASALALANNAVAIQAQAAAGGAIPLSVTSAEVVTGPNSGSLIRLSNSVYQTVYDIGIDLSGNLFINSPVSTQTALTLNGTTISFSGGTVQFPGLPPASSAPSGANLETVLVDTHTGVLYYQ